MRLLPDGADAISPPHHLDMESAEDLKYLVDVIREATDHRIPVIVKFAAGRIIDDVKAAVDAGVDAIAIDAAEAMGTTVPDIVGNEAGTPLIGAIGAARRAFRLTGARDKGIKLLITGGVRDASDIFKLLALGADAVGLDLPPLVALGCRGCFERCPKGDCPAGLSTTSPSLDYEEGARKISNLIRAIEDELKILIALAGHHTIDDLGPDDLRALTYDAAAISGAKLIGYERELPMWQH
jgi:glutamate synthase domain-containing protein 2